MVFLIIIIVVLGGGLGAAIFFIRQDEDAKQKQLVAYYQAVIARHNAWCRQVASVGGIVPATSGTIPGIFLQPNEVFYDLDPNAAQHETVTIRYTDRSGVFIENMYFDTSTSRSRKKTEITKGILAITNQRIIFKYGTSVWAKDVDSILGCSADNDMLRIIPSCGGEAERFQTADAMIMAKMIKIFRLGNPTSFCAHLPPNQRLEYVQSL